MSPFSGGFEVFVVLVVVLALVALWTTVKMVPQGFNYTVETFGRYTRTLSPGLPLVDTGYEEARELLEAQATAERILRLAKGQASATAMELASRLPSLREATFSWLDQYQKGRFVVTLDTSDLQKGLTSIGSVSRNLTMGLIVAGQLVALALVLAVLAGLFSLTRIWREMEGLAYVRSWLHGR